MACFMVFHRKSPTCQVYNSPYCRFSSGCAPGAGARRPQSVHPLQFALQLGELGNQPQVGGDVRLAVGGGDRSAA